MKVIYAPLIHKDSMVDASPCLVSSAIELPFSQYRLFTENLFADHDFIRDCEEPLHRDSSGVNHCLLVLGEGSDDGILVRSDGHPHAVYAAFMPNARQFLRQQMHPCLEIQAKRMQKLVEEFTESAIKCQDEGHYSLHMDSIRYRNGGDPLDVNLFATMVSERPEFSIVEIEENRIHAYLAMHLATVREPPDVRRLTKREVTTMLAKHQLWLNGDGGECADFSKCFMDNMKLPGVQLKGANFDGAVLVNVHLAEANLDEASFDGTKFQGCDLYNVTADDASFTGASFHDTDLRWTKLIHCNFKNAVISGCELSGVGLSECCLDGTRFDEFGQLPSEIHCCSYDEEEWMAAPNVSMSL